MMTNLLRYLRHSLQVVFSVLASDCLNRVSGKAYPTETRDVILLINGLPLPKSQNREKRHSTIISLNKMFTYETHWFLVSDIRGEKLETSRDNLVPLS
jgi:hypothetical protein